MLRRKPVTGPPTMIIAIGIGQEITMYELNNMASWPYERNVIVARRFEDLPANELRLSSAICGGKYMLVVAMLQVA